MPPEPAIHGSRPVRRSDLRAGLRELGVRPGTVVFAHVRLSALGWVVGGVESVVRALLDCVGPLGTLATVGSWDDIPFRLGRWPRFPERLRTWPNARRSAHPDQRVIAVGSLAEHLTADHPLDDSFGPGSPFARLAEVDGDVLMLGAPLGALTLLHHAEALARVPGKRRWSYRLPFATDSGVEWRTLHDIDVDRGPFPYDGDCVAAVAAAALEAGVGVTGRIAAAPSHLFPAADLVTFAVEWLEKRFRAPAPTRGRTPA
jgi:aminoglycoside 3-N-acetyltransferase